MSDSEKVPIYPYYRAEIAKSGRSSCKRSKEKIPKGTLRIAKMTKNRFDEDGKGLAAWHLPGPFFTMLRSARLHTAFTIASDGDDEPAQAKFIGFDTLTDEMKAEFMALVAEHDKWLAMPPSQRPKPARKKRKAKVEAPPSASSGGAAVPSEDEKLHLVSLMSAFFTAIGVPEKANPTKLSVLLTKHVGGERALLEKMSTKNKSSLAVEDDKVRASPWWQMQGASGRPSAKRRKAAAAAPSVSSYAETTGVATRDTTYATFSDGAEPVFVFGPGAGGRTAKNMHKVLNKLVLPGGGAAVTRLDDNEAGKVKWSTFHAGGDRNCKAAVEKLNEVAKAHPSRPVFYIGASFGCRVGVAVMATRRAELEANVCDAMILTGFPLYPDEPKTEKKKMARVVHLATTLPSTRALIVAGTRDQYLHQDYLDCGGIAALDQAIDTMANKDKVVVHVIQGGSHTVPGAQALKKNNTSIDQISDEVAAAITRFCKVVVDAQ